MHFSKRFKKAWARSNQRMHDMLLARPPTRYLRRWPDPTLERSLPAPVSAAAMRARASERTLELAKPRPIQRSITPKKTSSVPLAVLEYQPTQRILELSRPAFKGKRPSRGSRRSTATEKPKKRMYSKERVNILARKKPYIYLPEEENRPAKPLSQLLPRIKILCELPKRYQSPDLPTVPVVTKLKLEDKGYEASERVKQLAQPKEYAEFKLDEDYDPYFIRPAVLNYSATDNIKKLAQPRVREDKTKK